MNQASKFLTSRQTAKAQQKQDQEKILQQKEKISIDKTLATDNLAQKEKEAISQQKVVHDFGLNFGGL